MIKKVVLFLILAIPLCGCDLIKRDSLENVDIYTTVYPVEYVVDYLYGYNSRVSSIYPAEVDLSTYSLTQKQINTYSKGAIFVYNGLSNEKSLARDLLNANTKLRIIDVSQGLDYSHAMEELWLNPRDYLMLAHNVKKGLEEYITNKYVIEEINKNYENLKVLVSGYDVELELIPENADDKNIVIASNALEFLNKYGFTVTNVNFGDNEVSTVVMSKVKKMIQNKTIKYVYVLDSDEVPETAKGLVESGAELIKIRSMTVKKESDIANNINYKDMMRETIDAIKKEVYE